MRFTELGKYVSKILFWQGKKRFIMKITGPPRMEFLHSIFPDAYFVDIIRDPRAVVASLMNVGFWKKHGFQSPFWEDTLSEEDIRLWKNKYSSSPAALTALENLEVFKQTKKELQETNANYMRIKYEYFVSEPISVLQNICEFANLEWSKRVEKFVEIKKYRNMNYKYKERLTKDQIRIVEEISLPILETMHYSVEL